MATAATAARHMVALPYPGRGHINPMLAVCRLLVAADGALTITVVVTEEWHGLLASAGVTPTLPDRVRLATVPNVIPSEHGRGADHGGFIEAVNSKMGEPVERLLDRLVLELGRRPVAIVADTYLQWAVAAGARRRIPVCSLWTQPATFFLALCHLDLWRPVVEGVSEEVRLSDVKIFLAWERPVKIAAQVFVNVRKAHCVLFTSFHELEASSMSKIAESLPCPVYPVGPSILRAPDNMESARDGEHRRWLEAQPENSVLYVSFGSFVAMPPKQLEEIAVGLRDSAVRIFWVTRDRATAGLREMCGNMGLAVPWCDQQEVLRHPSVGGFLSHCGWNSVLEAVCAGVPVIGFPVAWDQLVNARMIADEWKAGIDLREQRGEDGIVSRAAVSDAARKLMDLDSAAGQEMRKRAAHLREASRGAVLEGGSSHRSLSGFLKDLVDGKLEVAQSSA
ncbi:UDP-glycosyltransferase 87A1-like isoform X2 [Hordeum vulgare subsp. vulgare]|uniref:Glycosyltransferase n=1 Tax=Hordeum vulgare subsp. vulgare TaxID=112509 RepID=A0A287LTS8_HORVV|nr:UDP-glycosyltransferase 87A1-like isoform X2 [Hordeum vulgare subsp. vulgare]